MQHECPCGKQARQGGRQCAACYQREYRQRPGKREAHRRSVAAYQRRNYDRWLVWQYRWRERVGWRVPDLQALRAAINAIDAAVAQAEGRSRLRGSGQ
jgi:hypothetical protein